MLNNAQQKRLNENWGVLMECLECYAIVRLYDANGPWQCYLIAINPDDQEEVYCIISAGKNLPAEVTYFSMQDISCLYNALGERVQVDYEYRPKMAKTLLKELSKGIYEPKRN